MPLLVDLLTILPVVWISMLVTLCMSKKRLIERVESQSALANKVTADQRRAVVDGKNPQAYASAEAKTKSLTAANERAIKSAATTSEANQLSSAPQATLQQATGGTSNSPAFRSPVPQPLPLRAASRETTSKTAVAISVEKTTSKTAAAPSAEKSKPSSAEGVQERDKKIDAKKSKDIKGQEKRLNVFAAAAKKFRETVYPLKGIEQHPSTKKRGESWKSSKSKKSKKTVNAEIPKEEPQFLSDKSFKSTKANKDEPQFLSDKKVNEKRKPTEELFKSIKTTKTNKGKMDQDDDDDYDEGDDTLQGVKSLKQDLDIPSTVD